MLNAIGTQLAKFLKEEHIHGDAYYRIAIDYIKATLTPWDMVLMKGQSRVSAAIQFKNLEQIWLGLSQEN